MRRTAALRGDVYKGFKCCPVCGCRYQGDLDRHLNEEVRGSDGLSRCDWRLNEFRIMRQAMQMKDKGWRLAGSMAARICVLLAPTHPHLAVRTSSGSIGTKVHRDFTKPENDLVAWWIQRWAFPVTQVSGWSMVVRAQIIKELEGQPENADTVEAAWRIGGWDAVRLLEGGPIAKRCDTVYGSPVDAIISRGHTRLFDRCVLAAGHGDGVPHCGGKTGILWGPNFETVLPVLALAEPEPEPDDLDGPMGWDGPHIALER